MATTLDPTLPIVPPVVPLDVPPIAPPIVADTPSTPPVVPTLIGVNPSAVYATPNIQSIDIPSTKSAMDMKLSKLEKKLAKANSIADLNQISIINQPKAMGVLTGEAAYRDKLDTARVNAFNSLYNARIADEQRKEAERQQFIANYGADPKQRPKGMSKREFAKALQGGKFSNLLTEDFKQKQLQTATARQNLANTSATASVQLAKVGASLPVDPNTHFTDANNYVKVRSELVSKGKVTADQFDTQYGSLLSPDDQVKFGVNQPKLTAEQKAAADAAKPDPAKTVAQLDVLDAAITSANDHADSSGQSGVIKLFNSWFVGSTDYTNLVAETNTIRTNILTLATDPSIKKFFGPQMSNADVNLMTSAGTMLNPELQSPEQLKKSLTQAKDLLTRARAAVQDGVAKEQREGTTSGGNKWTAGSGTLPSGNSFTVTEKP